MDEMKKELDAAMNKWNERRDEMNKAYRAYVAADRDTPAVYAEYRKAEDAYYYAYEYYKGLSDMYYLACKHMIAIDQEREAHGI